MTPPNARLAVLAQLIRARYGADIHPVHLSNLDTVDKLWLSVLTPEKIGERYPVKIGELSSRDKLALTGEEDTPAYAIEIAREEQRKRWEERRRLTGAHLAAFRALRGETLTRRRLALTGSSRLSGLALVKWQIEAEETQLLRSRRRPKGRGTRIKRSASSVDFNLGPESIPFSRDGPIPARHYHDDGGNIEGKVPEYLFRQHRGAA